MKKLLLGLGTLASAVAPITTVVACGTNSSTTPENGNQNPEIDQALVDNEQTRVNYFVSTGATQENEIVTNNTHFTTVIALKYGLSDELYTDSFSYEYTSTKSSITIVVTKISNGSKSTIAAKEISVSPFVSKEILNAITQEQIASVIGGVVEADNHILPKDLTNLPEFVQVVSTINPSINVIVKVVWTPDDANGRLQWTATIDNRTNNTDTLAGIIMGFKNIGTANADSITEEQITSTLGISVDANKLPSEITNLPDNINVTPTIDSSSIIVVNLTWKSDDINGALEWIATIDNRSSGTITGIISGFIALIQDDIDNEQGEVNKLLSMGSTIAISSDREQLEKAPLDDTTIAKYGIKNVDGTPYTFKSDFVYKYTATDTLIKIYVSKNLKTSTVAPIEILISKNSFKGTFTSIDKEKKFLAITTTVAAATFNTENHITFISLPDVTTIGRFAFEQAPLTSLELPHVKTIENTAFIDSRFTILSLPEAVNVEASFKNSPLTALYLPKATNIQPVLEFFKSIKNSPETKVTLPARYNVTNTKNIFFGSGNWDQITFIWV